MTMPTMGAMMMLALMMLMVYDGADDDRGDDDYAGDVDDGYWSLTSCGPQRPAPIIICFNDARAYTVSYDDSRSDS